jgi:ProP effector
MNSDLPESAPAPAPEAAAPAAATSVADVTAELKALFPALFTGKPKPVKLRIQADIQERAPGKFSKAQLSAFLRRHTGSTGYLIALTQAKTRFDLDGNPAGEITEEHLGAAREELTRRKGLQQERQQQEVQQRRNRAQLLWDFERTTLTEANFCALKGLSVEELPGLLEVARKERAEAPPAPPREARRDDRRPDPRGPRKPQGAEGRRDQPRGERRDGGRPPQPGRKPGGPRPEGRQPGGPQQARPPREAAAQPAPAAEQPAADQAPKAPDEA